MLCSMIAQIWQKVFRNDRFDDNKSEYSEWEDENEMNFERNAFAFIIDDD